MTANQAVVQQAQLKFQSEQCALTHFMHIHILCLCVLYVLVGSVVAVYGKWIIIVRGSTTALVKTIKNISYFLL